MFYAQRLYAVMYMRLCSIVCVCVCVGSDPVQLHNAYRAVHGAGKEYAETCLVMSMRISMHMAACGSTADSTLLHVTTAL